MFSQMTARGMVSYPLKEDLYVREGLILKNQFKDLPTTFKRDYFLELKKNPKVKLKTQEIALTCLNIYCTHNSVKKFNHSISLCQRCWRYFQSNCCLPTFASRTNLHINPNKKEDVSLDFPAPPFKENAKRQKFQNTSQEFKPQPSIFSQDLPDRDIKPNTSLKSFLTSEGQSSYSNANLNNILAKEVLNVTLKFSRSPFVKNSDPVENSNSANSTEKEDDIFSTLENIVQLPDDKNECCELDIFYGHFAEKTIDAPRSLIKRACFNFYCKEINPDFYSKLSKICKTCEEHKKACGIYPRYQRRLYKEGQ